MRTLFISALLGVFTVVGFAVYDNLQKANRKTAHINAEEQVISGIQNLIKNQECKGLFREAIFKSENSITLFNGDDVLATANQPLAPGLSIGKVAIKDLWTAESETSPTLHLAELVVTFETDGGSYDRLIPFAPRVDIGSGQIVDCLKAKDLEQTRRLFENLTCDASKVSQHDGACAETPEQLKSRCQPFYYIAGIEGGESITPICKCKIICA